jgi:Protein of unknown function (DUF2911)
VRGCQEVGRAGKRRREFMVNKLLALLFFGFLVAASTGEAQLRASERASVSQTVDGTVITVNYSRPMARGRTGLFGTRVYWGETWTPGANQATTVSVTKDVTIEGTPVPKGTYSVWIQVERGPWEMMLDRDTQLVHHQAPRQRPGQIRFPITREQRPFMEGLTWWFPEVQGITTTLAMQWDTVYVPLTIRVPLSYSTAVAPAVARRIAGVYQVHHEPEQVNQDTTLHQPVETIRRDLRFTVRQQGTELRGVMDPPMYTTEEGWREWLLIPIGEGNFILGRVHHGVLVEVITRWVLEFDPAGDRARSFEVRTRADRLIGTGTRTD